jgi:Na+:H+ antiporter, NhaC family
MSAEKRSTRTIRPPSLLDSLIPLATLIVLLALSVGLYGVDATLGPLQVALFMATVVGAVVAVKNGHTWEEIGTAIVQGISTAMSAIFILLMVGALIGVWNMSGTIATIVYAGIEFLEASWFYFAAALVTGVVGLATGSSWTTAATIGVALVSIARVMGVSPEITAGAVISGAYFGDKMTPISETTILVPQLVGSNVPLHIRSMMRSTIPAFLLALVGFLVLGLTGATAAPPIDKQAALDALSSVYAISLWTLIPVVVLLILSFRRFPAFMAILIGTLVGGLVAVVLQPELVLAFVNDPTLSTPLAMLKGVWSAMATGFTLDSGFPAIDTLFSGGGMSSMLYTVWLILGAMAFGAITEYAQFSRRLIDPLLVRARSAGALIATVMATAIGLNIFAGDQYVAIILPARMFLLEFKRRGLHPENLATAVENSGTVTSPLVPWNSCGAYMTAALGVSTFLYFPYCFFNFLNPILGAIFGFTGRGILRLSAEEAAALPAEVPTAPPAPLVK